MSVDVIHFTDPACPWAYSAEPDLNALRYRYGAGLRFALSQALEARVDVGFSDEEKGLVYLAFAQAF